MATLISLGPELDWQASGGLFDWTLEFLIDRLEDDEAIDRLREIVDNNLGSLWLSDLPPRAVPDALRLLADELIPAGERALPDGDHKTYAIEQLRTLAALADHVRARA